MNEELSNQGEHNRPQPDNEPASEQTKQQILDIIREKSKGGYHYKGPVSSFVISRLTLLDNPEVLAIHVLFIPEDERKSDNGAVEAGSVVRNSKYPNGLVENAGYKLFLTPDKTIEIEKDLSLIDHREEMKRDGVLRDAIDREDHALALSHAEESRDSIIDHIEFHKQQRALGLNFVSEAEAASLLSELQKAQPATS